MGATSAVASAPLESDTACATCVASPVVSVVVATMLALSALVSCCHCTAAVVTLLLRHHAQTDAMTAMTPVIAVLT